MKISKFIPAAAIAASVALAPQASAFTGNQVCSDLDSNPTVRGVEIVAFGLLAAGHNTDVAANTIVTSVQKGCPEYIPLLQQFVKKWS